MKAIQIHEFGDSSTLQMDNIEVPEPGEGQVRVKVKAAGLNFIDTYHRQGWYPVPLPFTPGVEAAGVVDAVGNGVADVAIGDRVAYCMSPGNYAEYALTTAANVVPIPEGVSFEQAAAVLLQGMTAHYLTHSTYSLSASDTMLLHAAAGGTGQLVVQMAKMRGATVIGTCSTEEKAALVREAGGDYVILYTERDFAEDVEQITNGEGCDVVYDSVGKTTFDKSLTCLKPRGLLALFGQASGPVDPFDIQRLNQQGSIYLTRPSLGDYIADRTELLGRANDLFGWMSEGKLTVRIDNTFPLADASAAHNYLEGRSTKGKVLLIP